MKDQEVHVTKIIKEGDDLVMLFQPDLLTKLKFEVDSIWQWIPQDDGTIILNNVAKSNLETE
jgi:hypothetical protein